MNFWVVGGGGVCGVEFPRKGKEMSAKTSDNLNETKTRKIIDWQLIKRTLLDLNVFVQAPQGFVIMFSVWANSTTDLVTCGASWPQQFGMVSATVQLTVLRMVKVDQIHQLFLADVARETRGVPQFIRSRLRSCNCNVATVQIQLALQKIKM